MSSPVFGKWSVNESWRRNREGVEAPRNSLEFPSSSARWIAAGHEDIPFSFQVPAFPDRTRLTEYKTSEPELGKRPSVVAQLMGLDMFPTETKPETEIERPTFSSRKSSARVKSTSCESREISVGSSSNATRELLEAMEFLRSNKHSFLHLLRILPDGGAIDGDSAENNTQTMPVEDQRHESSDSKTTRIVVLKPGPAELPSSPKDLNTSQEQQTDKSPPEKILHAVTSKDFVQDRLRSGPRNAKEIAQAIARQARETAFKDLPTKPVVAASDKLEVSQCGSAPTLRRFMNFRQGLENTSLPSSQDRSAVRSQCLPRQRRQEQRDELEERSLRAFRRPSSEMAAEGNNGEHSSPVSVLEFQSESPSFRTQEVREEQNPDAKAARTLDFDSARTDAPQADMIYIWKVVSAIGSLSARGFDVRWLQKSALSSRLFRRLEAGHHGRSSSHRRLLFDVTNEILARKYTYQKSWKLETSLRKLTLEVCGELFPKSKKTIEDLFERDIAAEISWADSEELQMVVIQITNDIFNSLVEQTVHDLLIV